MTKYIASSIHPTSGATFSMTNSLAAHVALAIFRHDYFAKRGSSVATHRAKSARQILGFRWDSTVNFALPISSINCFKASPHSDEES
jgi:hypothetical protein